MVAMLPPAPRNKAAEARATKAMSKVYSMRSCPSSALKKFLSQRILAGLCLRSGVRQLRVGGIPDRLDASARAEEQRCRGQSYEGNQEGIFDQVLPLLVFAKVKKHFFHVEFAP